MSPGLVPGMPEDGEPLILRILFYENCRWEVQKQKNEWRLGEEII